jgi:2-oxoglutarate ferredoxin oxidoreductase subunit alpha
MIVLAPNSVQEMYDHTYKAFDLADKYRMTVMILSDGLLGQMMEPVTVDNQQTPLNVEKPWMVGNGKINCVNSLFLHSPELEKSNNERFAKYKIVEDNEVLVESYRMDDAEIVVAAYGASSRVSRNAVDAAREQGIKAGMLRPVTLWPFPKAAFAKAAEKARAFITVEMSMGQMIEDVELAIRCRCPVIPCNRVGGVIPPPENVLTAIQAANK